MYHRLHTIHDTDVFERELSKDQWQDAKEDEEDAQDLSTHSDCRTFDGFEYRSQKGILSDDFNADEGTLPFIARGRRCCTCRAIAPIELAQTMCRSRSYAQIAFQQYPSC
jgi:hypothetical protein